jgi:hypothetical protein
MKVRSQPYDRYPSSSGAAVLAIRSNVEHPLSVETKWLAAAGGVTLGAVAVTAAVGSLAGTIVALVGAGGLALLKRRMTSSAGPSVEVGRLTDRQRQTLPEWYAEREVFPVPGWAWAGVAVLVFIPYLLGQVHVLSEDHSGNWLVIGFVASGFLLYASGAYERAKARRSAP